ncbi:hypothetical protein LZ554_003035 [Drepanopeziza brunnea f. sp. 'monogermtubi']|nr:hypothetical protein LZ554_003035 [Drepanopeziza brunnea f. sp. 'monogermtubi']
MAELPKKNPPTKLKIRIGPKPPAGTTPSQSSQSSPPAQDYLNQSGTLSIPSLSTPPSVAPSKKPSLKLKTKVFTPGTAHQDVKPKKSKAGRPARPSAKLIDNKKRGRDDESQSEAEATIKVQPPKKKQTIIFKAPGGPRTPVPATPTAITPVMIKAKVKGKPPKRIPGEGYDSEASDREIDPVIEEEFILRMAPGEDCDYLRDCIAKKLIGGNRLSNGADVSMKFYQEHGRRASVTIRGRVYAATMVDLPCIIEGMKSWDKRGWWKSADICQMLWVFAQVNSEAEAKTIPLPEIIDQNTFQYPHGLTAPMHNVRKRRFRKRMHKVEIEKVEAEVERLMEADSKAVRTKHTIIDPGRESRRQSEAFSRDGSNTPFRHGTQQQYSENEEDGEEDAEGEEDDGYFINNDQNDANVKLEDYDPIDDALLEADLEAAMEADFGDFGDAVDTGDAVDAAGTPIAETPSVMTPSMSINMPPEEEQEEADSGDDSVEDDDDDESSEIDAEERNRLNQIQGMKEDIAEMERELVAQEAKLVATSNLILKKRIEDQIRKLKTELQLKKSSIGEGEGEDNE